MQIAYGGCKWSLLKTIPTKTAPPNGETLDGAMLGILVNIEPKHPKLPWEDKPISGV